MQAVNCCKLCGNLILSDEVHGYMLSSACMGIFPILQQQLTGICAALDIALVNKA